MPSKRGRKSKSKRRKLPIIKSPVKDLTILNDVTHSVKIMHLADTIGERAEDARDYDVPEKEMKDLTDIFNTGTGIYDVPKREMKGGPSESKEVENVKLPPGDRKVYGIFLYDCPDNPNDALEFYVDLMKDVMSRDEALAVLKDLGYKMCTFYAYLTEAESEKLLTNPNAHDQLLGVFLPCRGGRYVPAD